MLVPFFDSSLFHSAHTAFTALDGERSRSLRPNVSLIGHLESKVEETGPWAPKYAFPPGQRPGLAVVVLLTQVLARMATGPALGARG